MRGSSWKQRLARAAVACGLAAFVAPACDDAIAPKPPKQHNQAPETFLVTASDSLRPQFYKIRLRWLGSDPDGRVAGFRYRWTELCSGPPPCPRPPAPEWVETAALSGNFMLSVPEDSANYLFEVAAVDNEGAVDPDPAQQIFDFRNAPPIASFLPGSLPARTLPATTFYLRAADPDTTVDPDDGDAVAHLDHYLFWLDGNELNARVAPFAAGSVTLRPEDFAGVYGSRTVFVRAFDDGGAGGPPIQHTWTVDAPPPNGILLVDDCRMGGTLEGFSDQSYRNVLEANAPGRYVVLDIETVPRPSAADYEAQLSLFDRVVWYTDADTTSSGALQLSRAGLEALLGRNGSLFLASGLVFGTRSAFGEREGAFRRTFGIDSVFAAPNGGTNFTLSLSDTVRVGMHSGLGSFRFLSLGLRAVMECFASAQDASSLYFYPESTFVRDEFANPVQFDIGVARRPPGGPSTVYVSFPLGVPINDNAGENEIEIRELLRLAGILEP